MNFMLSITLLFSSSIVFSKDIVDRVVAIVNSEPILKSELDSMPERSKKDGAIDDALLLDEKRDTIKSDTKTQLDYLIREKLVESEVKRLNLSLSDDAN
jgi:peptidyl-prolyl cis-trans isomerase SurA